VASPSSGIQIATLRAGEGFLSQSSKWLHFGLGTATAIDRVIVHWPASSPQTFVGLQVDGRYRLLQGRPEPEPVGPANSLAAISEAEQELPADTRVARVALMTRLPMPSIEYTSNTGTAVSHRFDSGTPVLVSLWASWCRPCLQELAEWNSQQARLAALNLNVVSLSVDRLGESPTSPERVVEAIEKTGYGGTWGYIDVPQMDRLQELHDQFFFPKRPLPLPSSFLIDARGRLAVIYRGPVSVDQVLKDIQHTADSYRQMSEAAACLPGRCLEHDRILSIARQTDLQMRYQVAAWLEERNRYQDAIRSFVELHERDPQSALAQRHLAKLYLHENRLPDAEEFAARALRIDPQNARAHNTMGLIRSRQGNERAAEAHLRTAIKLDGQFAEAYNNLGSVLADQGRLDEAGKLFGEAIGIDGKFAEAHLNLGSVYAAQNDVAKAISHYQTALKFHPDYVDAYNNLGTMFARRGDLARAVDYYREALRVDPQNPDASHNLQRAIELLKSIKQ
jgi:tetratricopeptide (TPR) repeat protein